MRTTVTINDSLLEKARSYAGVEKVSELIDLTLKKYIAREASCRLAALGGSDPYANLASRRRTEEEPLPEYSGMLAEPQIDFHPTEPKS